METFEDWLQNELRLRGWILADLARHSRVSPPSLSRILSGERRPGPKLCAAIARALGIPAEEVFRRAGLLPPSQNQQAAEREDELLRYYRDMAPRDRERLLAIARVFHDAAVSIHNEPPTREDLLRFLDTLSDDDLASLAEAIRRRRRAT